MSSIYPQLNIYLDGAETPTVVQVTSVDFWAAETLFEKARQKMSAHGARLIIAFIAVHEKEPESLGAVKEWARANRVFVEDGEESVRPTQSVVTADS